MITTRSKIMKDIVSYIRSSPHPVPLCYIMDAFCDMKCPSISQRTVGQAIKAESDIRVIYVMKPGMYKEPYYLTIKRFKEIFRHKETIE